MTPLVALASHGRMRATWGLLSLVLMGCDLGAEERRLARLEADRVRREAAASAEIAEAMNAPAPPPTDRPPTKEELRAENEALAKAKAADAKDLKKQHDAFPAKVKREAGCATAEIEAYETLHVEGCPTFYPPGASPALFEEAKALGFRRIHNHSIGKAWCSYYLSAYPQQKLWKCNNAGGSWPGP